MTRAGRALLIAVAVAVLTAVPLPGRRDLAPRASARPAAGSTAGGSGGIVVAAAGDIACAPGSPATVAGCQQRATARAVLAQHPRAVLLLGDNQYKDGARWAYRASYAHSWGRFLRRTYPTPGNHEDLTKGATGYYRYFARRAAAPVRPWYSFHLGSWHLVALNSNCGVVDCTAEAAWLRADLAAHPTRCTLAFWHHPRFSSGSEGETMAVGPFWDALYAAGADVVLNGHDHDYERFAPQGPLGEPDPVNGIREFVVGTGGAPWLPLRAAPAANTLVRATATFGVLRLTLRPRGYAWRYVNAAGSPVTDQGQAACH
jgi:3',5'-cyclic AMP phosphodiesterase CpdA